MMFSDEFDDDLEAEEAKYNVISSNFNDDNTVNIRVSGESNPGEGFSSVEANLEDVYFTTLGQEQSVEA